MFQFVMPPRFRRGLYFRSGMIVDSFGLEEDGVVDMSPEVGHWISTVSLTRHQLQVTTAVWTRALLT